MSKSSWGVGARRRPVYVEVLVRAPIDEVWEQTQKPDLHARWDLRFTAIDYLPRGNDEPQRFLYTTRLGGFAIEGTGESIVSKEGDDGFRTSALTFRSDDRRGCIVDYLGTHQHRHPPLR